MNRRLSGLKIASGQMVNAAADIAAAQTPKKFRMPNRCLTGAQIAARISVCGQER
ncbi:MAG: hypothetical protein OXE94_11285 [Aestuariivita sp.]|nr:hypothetical protein [Aestuariivita sp.]